MTTVEALKTVLCSMCLPLETDNPPNITRFPDTVIKSHYTVDYTRCLFSCLVPCLLLYYNQSRLALLYSFVGVVASNDDPPMCIHVLQEFLQQ